MIGPRKQEARGRRPEAGGRKLRQPHNPGNLGPPGNSFLLLVPASAFAMPLTTYDDALTRLLALIQPMTAEIAALAEAGGRVLAEPIIADRDLPPFHRSAMDGYAVRLTDTQTGIDYPVTGTVAAGGHTEGVDTSGVIRIATGAAVPEAGTLPGATVPGATLPGAAYDAVIPIEQAQPADDGKTVRFTDTVRPGFAVHPRGADARTGDTLISPGTRLKAHHLGIAASAGVMQIPVRRKPRVVVLSTGDELRPPSTPTAALAPQQIRNSNGPMLCALAQAAGAEVIRHDHLMDELDATVDGAQRALQDADLILTSGGVSVGDRDHLPAAWAQAGAQTLLHGVAIQPGKPVLIVRSQEQNAIVLGLPGNPVSVLATFHLFALPAIRALLDTNNAPTWRTVTLAQAVRPKAKRELFRAVTVDADNNATLLPWQGSGDLSHTSPMHGFIRLPQQDAEVPAGTRVDFLPILDA